MGILFPMIASEAGLKVVVRWMVLQEEIECGI